MNGESSAAHEDDRRKAIALFQYLKAVTQLRFKQPLDVTEWDRVLWFDGLPDAPKCVTRLHQHDLNDWIRIERPPAPPAPPPLPAQLQGLVPRDEIEDWRRPPRLAPKTDDPVIRDAWERYQDRWIDWSADRETEEPWRETYRQFFATYNRAAQLGEQYEVVVAVGLLSWQQTERRIRRHLVTASASISLDADSGIISVAPAGTGSQLILLEDEIVPAGSRPPSEVVNQIGVRLENADSPFEEPVKSALREWVQTASADGSFSDDLQPADGATATPEVRFAPAVILRRRQGRSLLETYDQVIDQLERGNGIPAVVGNLAEHSSASLRIETSDRESSAPGFDPTESPLFPLPANPQQHKILEELAGRRGVVVQGPPGTGKSHTIANLISHCLATGRRVLVTSHTDRALRVLKEQLPEEIRDLAVSVLGAGREGAADLQACANALLARRNDPRRGVKHLRTVIDRLGTTLAELQESRQQRADTIAELRAAASESHQLPSGYSGPVGDIAAVLADERESHGWFPDRVSGPMPLSYAELVELRGLRDRIQRFEPNLRSYHFPAPNSLPPPEQVESVRQAKEAADRLVRRSGGDHATAERLRTSTIDLAGLAARLREHDDADRAVRRRSAPWLDDALRDLDAGRTNRWTDLRQRTKTYLERSFAHPYDGAVPSAINASDLPMLADQSKAICQHLQQGRRLKRAFGPQPRLVKRCNATFDAGERLAVPLHDGESATRFRFLVHELQELDELSRHWGQPSDLLEGTLAHVRARFRDYNDTLDDLAALAEARDHLSSLVGDTLSYRVKTAEDVAHLSSALQLAEALNKRDAADAEHRDLLDRLRSEGHAKRHPSFKGLVEAAAGLSPEQYRARRDELLELIEQREQLDRFDALRDSLRSVAPRFTEALTGTDPIEIPEADALDRAWRWSRAMNDVQRLRGTSESELIAELSRLDSEIASYTRKLVENQAWYNTLKGLSEEQSVSLKSYQLAIRNLGKGFGKRAASHRRHAQQHLARCQSAVRAWIMPTYRVAETLTVEPESFDVVIIDEASQSGVDALFLFWLGKQVVVVGDDNQISPANVGINVDDVAALQGIHLDSFQFRNLLGIENSLFDQAKVRFSGEVWLTEHFRCMPEIIEFSNRLLYRPQQRPLEPLRQFGNDRLPPLVRRFVPHGEREGAGGRAVNRAEADALIEALIECHEDPRYDGLSFGVIGLLGGQADYIEGRLLERLPSDVWHDRRLRCGDAYDFQGDERDVIFLSMVRSLKLGEFKIPALGQRADEQRFNVAASRARDQMWLFHSMTAEQLNPQCVRFKLLNHFLQPPETDMNLFDEPVERDVRHPAFDSLFEQRVFLDIRERGYAVRPQFEAYGYRIDIVVAGAQRKLAVECDGAAWHGHEQYAKDLARQRDLERAGWTFFRVRDTDYYLNRKRALEPLWDLLQEHGIHPRGMGGEAA
ncbi:MAG: AAA domain-containing protein [bacterium]|nr:AAA domain-containing protein [bacterium]